MINMPEQHETAVHGAGNAIGHAGTSSTNEKKPGGR
jgi:hypothetical protein